MNFKIRFRCGETEVGDAEIVDSIEAAHGLIALKAADLDNKADIAIIFRISPSGTEEWEESRQLHA